MSYIDSKAFKIFVDQQKWNLYKFVKVSLSASYDSIEQNTTLDSHTIDANYLVLDANNEASDESNAVKLHSKYVATCFVARRPGYYFYNAYFIIFLITVLSLTTFSIDCKYPQNRLQTTFTLVLTSASFKWVINRSLPTISYMTSLDKYSIICIFFLCLICVWHSAVASFFTDVSLATKIDQLMFLFFIFIFSMIHIVFSIWLAYAYKSIRKLEKLNGEFLKELRHNEKLNMLK
jgi:hypothetical protein